ncbi:MAG: type IVB secretion system protein IcmH/DotU [Gammaproteobacteria bacterium]
MNHLFDNRKIVPLHQPAAISANYLQENALPCDRQTWQRAAFSVNTGVNTLVNSAAVLFSTLTRLWHATIPTEISHFNQALIQEVTAFENKALLHGYQETDIILARFCICAAIDEAITHNAWDRESKKKIIPLLLHFHNKKDDDEYVFDIIAQLSLAPQKNKSILTFIYLCLALGYEGKYRYMADGKEQWIQQRHHLYQLITQRTLPSDIIEISGQTLSITESATHQEKAWSLARWCAIFGALYLGLYSLCFWGEYNSNQSVINSAHELSWPTSLHDDAI